MNRFVNIYPIITVLSVLYSCSPSTYIRNAVNVPLFEDKKELQVTGYLNPTRLELQTAYSINSNLGVMANGYVGFSKAVLNKSIGTYDAYLYDLGLGYLTRIGDRNLVEIFLGAGQGWVHGKNIERHWGGLFGGGQWNLEWLDYQTDFSKYFFQFNYAYVLPNWKLGFSFRNSLVHYKNYEYAIIKDDYVNLGGEIFFTDSISQKDLTGYVLDPIVNIQWGRKRFKIVSQIGLSLSLFDVNHNTAQFFTDQVNSDQFIWHPKYNRVIFNIGFKYTFGGSASKNPEDPIVE